ncbi:MAG: SPASM domain-containing protein [Candidatus Firestonebacteria bacterium]|nr:SPASM domain-containing protein [Candidatus Firestonebacteria bacterium]
MQKNNCMILKTPLRVTWKISNKSSINKKILTDLITSRIFLLKLNLGKFNLNNEEVSEVINTLTKNGVRVSINIDISAIDELLSLDLLNIKFDKLIFEIQSVKELQKNSKKVEHFNKKFNLPKAVSISLTNNNISEVSSIVENAKNMHFREIIFINDEIADKKITNKKKYNFSTEKWDGFKKIIKKNHQKWNKEINFTIHDYFIWKEFPKQENDNKVIKGEYNGCQAGNVLAYISTNGDVFPCASMPFKMGNLQESNFQEIWASEKRKMLYNTLNSELELCMNCRFVDCKGGCKGMSYFLYNNFNNQDRLCPFKVKEQL